MKRSWVLLAILVEGCAGDTNGLLAVPSIDASTPDGSVDAAVVDSAPGDAAILHADASLDAGSTDASVESGATDAALDATQHDAAGVDAANAVDASADASAADSAPVDATALEAGSDASDGGLDFSCLGDALPSTAPASITLGGQTTDYSGAGLAGVDLQAHNASGTGIGMTTSGSGGAFTLTVVTGGVPIAGFLEASMSGAMTTYVFPPMPLASDEPNLVIPVVTPIEFVLLAEVAGQSQASTNGAIAVQVEDCGGLAVAGATVTTASGTVVYLQNGVPSTTATATDSDGAALVFDVPPGAVAVGASVQGMTLRAHAVTSVAGALTATIVSP
jgi:hypothetical protein